MHPIFDAPTLKWTDPDVVRLSQALSSIKKYSDPKKIIGFWYENAGGNIALLDTDGGPAQVWRSALEGLHTDRCLMNFCVQLKEDGPATLKDLADRILLKESAVRVKIISSSPVMDRDPLRDRLEELAKPGSNARVVIVRGGKKTGKSHGRLLFIEVAKEHGGTLISMQRPQVTVLRDVLEKLFGPIGGIPDKIRSDLDNFEAKKDLDTTDFAWLDRVGNQFLNTALLKQANLWIAMDNLGREQDAFLLPEEIKLFFDKLVLHMSSLAYLNHVRLMLMDYPAGDTPPGWEQVLWLEDTIDQNDVELKHVLETINSWCRMKNKNPHEDERREKSVAIIARAEEEVARANNGQPAYRIELIAKYLKEYLDTLL